MWVGKMGGSRLQTSFWGDFITALNCSSSVGPTVAVLSDGFLT